MPSTPEEKKRSLPVFAVFGVRLMLWKERWKMVLNAVPFFSR